MKTFNVGMRWMWLTVTVGVAFAQAPNGAEIYRRVCSSCHEQSGIARMPQRSVIAEMSPDKVLAALTTGAMQTQASSLSVAERRIVSEYLTGKTLGAEVATNATCKVSHGDLKDPLSGSVWNGWGVDMNNTRFQPKPGFSASDVPKLKLKWAYAMLPGSIVDQHSRR